MYFYVLCCVFFFKQKTAYEMRISDWSSDVCSSDLRDTARAQVAQIRANLRDRVIRAPFAGRLGIRQVSPGALVTPGTVIATLDDIARVYVDFPVPETQMEMVAAGQRLEGTASAFPGRVFDGTVSVVDVRLDAATRAVMVRGDFANPDRALRPGMLLQIELERPERHALVVPEIAIVQVGRDSFVFRVRDDDTVERSEEHTSELQSLMRSAVPTGTGRTFPGRVCDGSGSGVGVRLDAGTRAVMVRGDFGNPDRALRPGMLLQIELERPERQALVVPEIAIVQVGRDSFVFRVRDDDTVEQVPVAVGARTGGKAEVLEGLAPGDRIVVDGTGKLRAGRSEEHTSELKPLMRISYAVFCLKIKNILIHIT